MEAARPSRTAIGTALMRALHSRDGRPPLIDDPWGDRLFGDADSAVSAELDASLRAHPSYGTVILRARFAEDALRDAVARGVRQYVVVGAGMDSFALRRPAFARAVEVFEVDRPAMQEFKRERLAERGVAVPSGTHFVAVDLSAVALDDALRASAFRADRPAFFSWLGVTSYLPREANLATLRAIARAAPAGGELVFSYTESQALRSTGTAISQARAAVAGGGEPWVSGFEPEEIAPVLEAAGLALVDDLGPDELAARYCAGREDGLTPTPYSHVVHARIAQP